MWHNVSGGVIPARRFSSNGLLHWVGLGLDGPSMSTLDADCWVRPMPGTWLTILVSHAHVRNPWALFLTPCLFCQIVDLGACQFSPSLPFTEPSHLRSHLPFFSFPSNPGKLTHSTGQSAVSPLPSDAVHCDLGRLRSRTRLGIFALFRRDSILCLRPSFTPTLLLFPGVVLIFISILLWSCVLVPI